MGKKEDAERDVFCRFIEMATLPIDPASVRNEYPPKPDISCSTWQGAELNFELLELADFGFKTRKGASDLALRALERAFEGLSQAHALKASRAYRNALIYVDYELAAAKVHTCRAPQLIFDWLLELDPGFEGIVDWESDIKLPPGIAAITVYRGKVDGPIFEVSFKGAQFGADQISNLLARKLSNKYTAEAPIELLAYISGGFNFHPEVVRARFLRALEGKRDFGPFQRIWLADFRSPNPSALPLVPTSTDCSSG